MKLKLFCIAIAVLCLAHYSSAQTISGELKRWHKISITFDGPSTSETANPNPFSDYILDVTFKHQQSGETYKVPGFYAACADAQNSSCSSGNKWMVHFAPGQTGAWNWTASFKKGANVAINGGGSAAGFMNGKTGSFTVAESNKNGRDHRAANKGRLQYVGERYLRYSGTNPLNPNGDWFIKAGADSPENKFAYEDFDNTPNRGNRRKSWSPHQKDYVSGEASVYTWKGGKGSELLGAIRYLSNEGANAFSFLTMSLGGDDENVFPHLMKVDESTYNKYGDNDQWNKGVHKDRFDVSKLAQWEKIFQYADMKGMYMHFKTMETENDNFMDGNKNGRERKLYYRELIARFGHHLALNWNITEETTIPDDVAIDIINYINATDAYDHNIVIHTYPGDKDKKYGPLLGNKSKLTGASIQTGINNVHNDIKKWVEKSKNAGKKWVVANDEQGSAGIGVRVSDHAVRQKVLYGTLMAGGAGVEYYYGYTSDDGDLNGADHRKRGIKYKEAGHAIKFFSTYFQKHLIDAVSNDGITGDSGDFVLANNGTAYAIYRPKGGSTSLSLPSGNSSYNVQWFNPRSGGNLSAAKALGNTLVAPDNNDWVALITANGGTTPTPPEPTPIPTPTPPTASVQAIPGKIQAEDFSNQSGTQTETTSDVAGGKNIGYIENGDQLSFDIKVAKTADYIIIARVASARSGGKIVIKSDGKVVSEVVVQGTSGWQKWVNIEGSVPLNTGAKKLTLEFQGGAGYLFNVNWIDFKEKTNTTPTPPVPTPTPPTTDCDETIFEEKNGIVAVEAEHFISQSKTAQREWFVIGKGGVTPKPDPDGSHDATASGKQYIEILPDTRVTAADPLISGVNFTNTPGTHAVIDYKIKFNNPGKYFVWVRANSTGPEDNGIHVGIDGTWPASGLRMQWCGAKNVWAWESKQRTAANHCGEAQKIFVDVPTAGTHTISFSMREDGFEMDKFILSKAYTKPSGTGAGEVVFDCTPPPVANKSPEVKLTSPTNGTAFQEGTSMTLTATASDTDGTIAQVEFYVNGKSAGINTTAPYTKSVATGLPGNYTITAVAKDNKGATSTSSAVAITVTKKEVPLPPSPPTGGGSETIMLSPIHDAYIQGGKGYNISILRTESGRRVSYLMFDISKIKGKITGGKLKFTITDDFGHGNVDIYKGASNNWTETNLSDNNKPDAGVLLGNVNKKFNLNAIEEINLKIADISGDRLTLLVWHTSGNDFAFASKEHSSKKAPQLEITYVPGTGQRDTAEDPSLVLYPNPATNEVFLKSEALAGRVVNLYSVTGVLLKNFKAESNVTKIDVSGLASGYYLMTVMDNVQFGLSTFKVLVE